MSNVFKVGGKVRLKNQSAYGGRWKGEMVVDEQSPQGYPEAVWVRHPIVGQGSFFAGDIEHVDAFEIPKDFRFFRRSDGAISQAPYPTFEAALEGWRGFAQNGDQTEIVELVSHGTYKATLKVEVVEPISEEA